ncbi:hypothetical protein SDC9_78491 [bioreactor metagenome]|uniref:Uncharacterized protein n=1 Tax=bioreactor metagenome TaxID=1076179 RepID=A0A644Z162_9ZZZZ|nr:hypothetical protein [Clostridiales bacterium]
MRVKMLSLFLPVFLFSTVGLHSVFGYYTASANRLFNDEGFIISIPEELEIQFYNSKFFIPLPDNYESIDRGFIINIPDENEEATIQVPAEDGEQSSVSTSDDNGNVTMIQSSESEK